MNKYLVKKQFAHNSDIFSVGDVVEMNDADSAGFVTKGLIEKHVEEKTINAKVDSKEIADAVSKAIAGLMPVQKAVENKMTYGDYLQGIARKTINITTGAQGQLNTSTYWDPAVDTDILRESGIAQKAFMVSLSGQNNIYKKNVLTTVGNAPAVFAESATITASQPLITQFTFTLEKVAYRFDVTEEAMEDTGALVQEIENAVPEAFSKFIENGMINGSGTILVGIVGGTNTVVTPYVSLQPVDSLLTENVRAMYVRCKNPSRSNWVVSRSAYLKVLELEDSNGNALFVGPNGAADAPFGTLLGLPILISDYCAAVGTVGDIILGDFSRYQIVNKGGMKLRTSSEVSFLTDAQVFKFTYRLAGKSIDVKLTATDGTEIGSFVVLDDRNGST